MKKRVLKKKIKYMSDNEILENVAYAESKRKKLLFEKEFNIRFNDSIKLDEELAEELMVISLEADELML